MNFDNKMLWAQKSSDNRIKLARVHIVFWSTGLSESSECSVPACAALSSGLITTRAVEPEPNQFFMARAGAVTGVQRFWMVELEPGSRSTVLICGASELYK